MTEWVMRRQHFTAGFQVSNSVRYSEFVESALHRKYRLVQRIRQNLRRMLIEHSDWLPEYTDAPGDLTENPFVHSRLIPKYERPVWPFVEYAAPVWG